MTKLLTTQATKIDKSQNDDWVNVIMYLDPLYRKEVCLGASAGCRKSCLINSGRMVMPNAVNARRARTELYYNDPEVFMMQLRGEIMQALATAMKQGKRLAVRLNGTSDLDWSEVYSEFPQVQFYEYTKRPELVEKFKEFANVDLTFSKHENHTEEQVIKVLDSGTNVAVVFASEVPEVHFSRPVINGDDHDRRFEDFKGAIVGLKLKGTKATKEFAIKRGFAI